MSGGARAGRITAAGTGPTRPDPDLDHVRWHDLECGGYRADLRLWRTLADEQVPHHADAPVRVLDLGSGTGRVALDLASRGHRVLGVERRLGDGLEARVEAYERRALRARPRFSSADNTLELFPEIGPDRRRFAPDGGVTIEDAATANGGARAGEKLYPLHSAKVGGLAWKLMMTVSGLSLTMLGLFAFWSFWKRKNDHRRRRLQKRMAPPIADRPIAAGTLSFDRQP